VVGILFLEEIIITKMNERNKFKSAHIENGTVFPVAK
jgi:hypothetical protein